MTIKIIYPGSSEIVTEPVVRATRFYKDFDDVIWDWVSDFLDGTVSRPAFWELVKFRHPTHQINFHTPRAMQCLKYTGHEFIIGVDDNANK